MYWLSRSVSEPECELSMRRTGVGTGLEAEGGRRAAREVDPFAEGGVIGERGLWEGAGEFKREMEDSLSRT